MTSCAKRSASRCRARRRWPWSSSRQAADALDERPDFERPINPYAVSLRPERWDEDGLYAEPGVTLRDATELVESFADAIPAAAAGPSEEPFFLA